MWLYEIFSQHNIQVHSHKLKINSTEMEFERPVQAMFVCEIYKNIHGSRPPSNKVICVSVIEMFHW